MKVPRWPTARFETLIASDFTGGFFVIKVSHRISLADFLLSKRHNRLLIFRICPTLPPIAALPAVVFYGGTQ